MYQSIKCLVKVTILYPKKIKIRPKIMDHVFIGYAYNNSAYGFFVYKSSSENVHPNTIKEARNATCLEKMFFFLMKLEKFIHLKDK